MERFYKGIKVVIDLPCPQAKSQVFIPGNPFAMKKNYSLPEEAQVATELQ